MAVKKVTKPTVAEPTVETVERCANCKIVLPSSFVVDESGSKYCSLGCRMLGPKQ